MVSNIDNLDRVGDSEEITCYFDIELEGYESDNLADVYNEAVHKNELTFTFMGFTEPIPIATPCTSQTTTCSDFQLCKNSADNSNYTCENFTCQCLNGSQLLENVFTKTKTFVKIVISVFI